jgi:hypothetical protein
MQNTTLTARCEAMKGRTAQVVSLESEIEELEACQSITDSGALTWALRNAVFVAGKKALLEHKTAELESLLDPFEQGLEQAAEITKGVMS